MILKTDESQNTEYKESWNDKYLEWICGFANAQGGRIFIGVNDSHEVVGVADSKRLMEDIPNKIVTHLGIVCDVNLHTAEGIDYIEIIVEPNNVPISYRGHYHYRSGSTKQELKGVALQEFILRKLGRSWDDIGHTKAKIDVIDRDAIDYFLKKGINSGRIDSDELNESTHDVLDNLNLLDEDGNLKNAALLLFAKKPQKFFTSVEFQVGRFGKDEGDLLEQDIVEGNIIQMADKVMELIRFKYLHAPIHFEGMQRIETLEIPDKAFREILYNAIAHKLYSGTAIQMHVYDDRIEIWNDGDLPEGYTPETLLQRHSSKPRNKNIAFAFFKAGFIDKWGLGYKKIMEGFKEAGMKLPTIEQVDGGVRVTVWRKNVASGGNSQSHKDEPLGENLDENGENIGENYLTERQLLICSVLKANGENTAKNLARMLNMSQRTVEREISYLRNHGFIDKDGTNNGIWKVLKRIN